MLIKLELEVTPKQLTGIGQVLSGHMPDTVAATVTIDVDAKPETPAAPEVPKTVQVETNTPSSEVPSTPASPVESLVDVLTPPAPASPAADAFAGDAKEAPEKSNGMPANTATEQVTPSPTTLDQPAQTATDAAISVGNVDLAKGTNGQMIPWDVRIHGKAKKKNADASWRLIQGVDRDTLVPQVEAELVAALTAPKRVEQSPTASNVQTAAIPPTPPQVAAPASSTPAAPAAVTPPPPATAKPATFAELLPLVTAAKAAGTLTDETIASTCVELGLAQFGLIATRPDLIPQAAELLGV